MWCFRFTERIIRIIIKAKGKINKLKIKFTNKFPFTNVVKDEKSELAKTPNKVGKNGKISKSVAIIKREVFLNP